MKVFRIILKSISFLFFIVKFRHLRTAFLFSHYQVSFTMANSVRKTGNNIIFLHTGNQLPVSQLDIFKLGLPILIRALNYKVIQIHKVTNNGFIVNVNGIILNVNSVANIATIKEIFVESLYGLTIGDRDNVILDIGMNSGYASLFFAASPEISNVYSYEPFKETYNEALENFKLNSQLKDKIVAYEYGISNYTGSIEVPLLESGSAVGSTNELFIEHNQSNQKKSKTIRVQLQSIDEILKQIIVTHGTQHIYLKIDCEGEEYNILRQLDESGLLNSIKGFLIEWHIKGAGEIIERLIKHQFMTLNLPINVETDLDKPIAGMLYAFKK